MSMGIRNISLNSPNKGHSDCRVRGRRRINWFARSAAFSASNNLTLEPATNYASVTFRSSLSRSRNWRSSWMAADIFFGKSPLNRFSVAFQVNVLIASFFVGGVFRRLWSMFRCFYRFILIEEKSECELNILKLLRIFRQSHAYPVNYSCFLFWFFSWLVPKPSWTTTVNLFKALSCKLLESQSWKVAMKTVSLITAILGLSAQLCGGFTVKHWSDIQSSNNNFKMIPERTIHSSKMQQFRQRNVHETVLCR